MIVRSRRAATVGISGREARCVCEALEAAGFLPAGCAQSGPEGLRLIREAQPDLVVAGAIMPGLDGVAFAERARRLRLDVRPAILLLRPRGLRLPGEARLSALEALAIDAPASAGDILAAYSRFEAAAQALPPGKAAQLKDLLDALGVPEHPGRDCLARAVALVWRDRRRLRPLNAGLYPAIAGQTGLSPAQSERAIRHVIDAAWRTGEIEQQHRIFGDTIDARRGKPTCGEMIAQLADILRWEG